VLQSGDTGSETAQPDKRRERGAAVRTITLRELEEIMRQYVWEGEWLSFEQAPDLPFDELGYDSLALLETHSRIKRDYGVEISEEDFGLITTPKSLVDFVNTRMKAV